MKKYQNKLYFMTNKCQKTLFSNEEILKEIEEIEDTSAENKNFIFAISSAFSDYFDKI